MRTLILPLATFILIGSSPPVPAQPPVKPPLAKASGLRTHHHQIVRYIERQGHQEFPPGRLRVLAAHLAPLITDTATRHRLRPMLVASIVWHESNFHAGSVSPAGAIGLMQVMPIHFRSRGISGRRRFAMATNLDVGCGLFAGYLARMRRRYPGMSNQELEHRTLVAYNMGPMAVSRGIYRSRYSHAVLRGAR